MKQNIYSVSQVNKYLKNMISQDFLCSSIFVQGELSNVKYHGSGHIYFTLKDSGAAISCVMFASDARGLKFRMEEGQTVIVFGAIDVFVRDGKYQLYAKKIVLEGSGKLFEEYERLKKELEEMGMFDAAYKKTIPLYAKRVGVVTASTGAAIQDIINVSTRRNPYVEIILYPAIVQGDKAVPSIVRGIQMLENEGVDVMIVGRGGGSIEDLWAFNSREVAQAIFDCNIPIISAVGHETDTTISDYVADLRAPTPSAAAEMAVCEINGVFDTIDSYQLRLTEMMEKKLQLMHMKLQNYELKLKNVSPMAITNEKRMRILAIEDALQNSMQKKIQASKSSLAIQRARLNAISPTIKIKEKRLLLLRYRQEMQAEMKRTLAESKNRFAVDVAKLSALSPMQKLAKGYGYVTDENGSAVRNANLLKTGDELTVWLKDAKVLTTVKDVWENKYD